MTEQTFDAEALVKAAKAGDVNAMYRLATLLGAEGHKELSVTWLKKAASNGHGDARFTLATFYLKGINLERNVPQALMILEAAVKEWHMPSVQLYSSLKAQGAGTDRNWSQAADLLLLSASRGFSPAMVELAFLLILSGATGQMGQTAHHLMQAAACRKNLHAGLYLAASLSETSELIDQKMAAFWVTKALQMGHPSAAAFADLAASQPEPEASWIDCPPLDAESIKAQLDRLFLWTPKQAVTLFDRPRVEKISQAVPVVVCEYLKGLSMPRLQAATAYDPETGDWVPHDELAGHVSSFWPEDHSLVSYVVAERMAKAAGSAHQFAEGLTFYMLPEGGHYRPHSDFIDPSFAGASEQLSQAGQAIKTVQLMIDMPVGGGDSQVGMALDPIDLQRGDMMIVHNILGDQEIDDQAVLADAPVVSGEKWVAQRLIREKEIAF